MQLKDNIDRKREEVSVLAKELGDLYLRYNSILNEKQKSLISIKNDICCYRQELFNYSCFNLNEVAPYMEKLLSYFEEEEYCFHKSNVKILEGHYDYDRLTYYTVEKEFYMISKYDDIKNSYELKCVPECNTNELEENHIIFDKYERFNFYNKSGNEAYFMKKYPYIKDFIDCLIDVKYDYGRYYLFEEELEDAYNRTIMKYDSKKKVKKM